MDTDADAITKSFKHHSTTLATTHLDQMTTLLHDAQLAIDEVGPVRRLLIETLSAAEVARRLRVTSAESASAQRAGAPAWHRNSTSTHWPGAVGHCLP